MLIIPALQGFPSDSDGKESACNAGDPVSILGMEKFWRRECYPLRYSCLEISMDRGALHRVTKSHT